MAFDVKGITIEVGADASRLTDQLKAIKSQYSGLDKLGNQLKRSMTFDGKDVSSLSGFLTQQKLLEQQIKQTKEECVAMEKTLQHWDDQVEGWKTNIAASSEALEQYSEDMKRCKKELNEMQESHLKMDQTAADTERTIEGIRSKTLEYEHELKVAVKVQEDYRKRMEASKKSMDEGNKAYADGERKLQTLLNKIEAGTIDHEKYAEGVRKAKEQMQNASEQIMRGETAYQEYARAIKDVELEKRNLQDQIANNISLEKRYESQLKEERKALAESANAIEEKKNEIKQLDSEMNSVAKTLEQNQKLLENEAKSHLTLQGMIEKTRNRLEALTSQFVTGGEKAQAFSYQMRQVADAAGKVSEKAEKVAESTKWLSMGSVAVLTAAAKATVDYEDAWTGVTKTVEGTPEQMAKLNEELKQIPLNTASSYEEVAAFAEMAGQMGVATNEVAGFTKTVTQLADSTNLVGEVAAQSLARIANIMVEKGSRTTDYYERLGSTIVDLGNNFATTESEIVDMSERMATAGRAVGMSTPQVLALSTALSSVGIEAAAGGGSMSKLMSQIQLAVSTGSDSLEMYANVAGKTAAEFAKAWRDDAGTAFMEFIAGIGKTDDVTKTLADLEINEIRMSNGVRALAQSTDIYVDALNRSDLAWENNTAMTIEAEKRYGTMKSQLNQTKEAVMQAAEALGKELIPYVKAAADKVKDFSAWFKGLNKGAKDAVVGVLAFTSALSPVAKTTSVTAKAVSAVADAMSKMNVQGKQGASGLNLIRVSANPVSLAIGGVTAALVAATVATKNWHDAEMEKVRQADKDYAYYDGLKDRVEKATDAARSYSEAAQKTVADNELNASSADSLAASIQRLQEKESLSSAEKALMSDAVQRLQQIYPELNLAIDTNTGKLQGNTDEFIRNLEAVKKNATERALAKAITEQTEALAAEKIAYDGAQQTLNHYGGKLKEATAAVEEMRNAGMQNTAEFEEQSKQVDYYAEEWRKAKEAIGSTATDMARTNAELISLQNQLDTGGVDQIGQSIKDTLGSVTQLAQQAGYGIPQTLTDGLNSGSMSVKEASDALGALVTFQGAVDDAGMFGGRIPQELAYTMMNGATNVTDAIAGLNRLIEFSDALDAAGVAGVEVPQSIAQGIFDGSATIQKSVAQISTGVVDKTKEMNKKSESAVKNSKVDAETEKKFSNAQKNADKNLQKIPGAAGSAMSSTAGVFNGNNSVPSAADSWGSRVYSQTAPHFQDIANAAKNARDDALRYINEAKQAAANPVKVSVVREVKETTSTPTTPSTGGSNDGAKRSASLMSVSASMPVQTMAAMPAAQADKVYETLTTVESAPATAYTNVAKGMSELSTAVSTLNNRMSSLEKSGEILKAISKDMHQIGLYIDSEKAGELLFGSVRKTGLRYDRLQSTMRGVK